MQKKSVLVPEITGLWKLNKIIQETNMAEKITQTAGRDQLGDFAASEKDRYQNSIFFPIGEPNP